jgi:hypothetical protein
MDGTQGKWWHTAGSASGRNLSQEAEWRLENSFQGADLLDQGLDLAFGPQAVGLALLVAQVGNSIGAASGTRHWLSDPYAFDQVVQGVAEVLSALRPPGEIIEPEASSGAGLSLLVSPGDRRTLGSRVAEGALRDIARATIENAYGEWGERVRRRFEGAPLDRMFAKWVNADG